MPYITSAFVAACLCLHPALTPLQAQSPPAARLPPKGCWRKNLVWTLARQDLPVLDATRWTVLAQLPWAAWKIGIPIETVRGDQLRLTVITLDNWRILLTSGPGDEPVVLTRLDVLCSFLHEEPDLRIVFSTRVFR